VLEEKIILGYFEKGYLCVGSPFICIDTSLDGAIFVGVITIQGMFFKGFREII
jgi:hypothetical protein